MSQAKETSKSTLKIKNLEFEYFYHWYNNTELNERKIEVPLGMYIVHRFGYNVLEVGAVLPNYLPYTFHRCIDIEERHNRVYNMNALTFDYTCQNILSLSTVEHFGENRRGGYTDLNLAFTGLSKMVKESVTHFITFPCGVHPTLGKQVEESGFKYFVMIRDKKNEWSLTGNGSTHYRYAFPYNGATAICILTNLKEFYD